MAPALLTFDEKLPKLNYLKFARSTVNDWSIDHHNYKQRLEIRNLNLIHSGANPIYLLKGLSMSNDLTIIIPVFNEEEVIRQTLTSISNSFELFRKRCRSENSLEILVVNDGSRDGTLKEVRIAAETIPNAKISVISLSRNWGHQRAVWCGLKHATRSKYVGVIDADGQDPPETLFAMFAQLIGDEKDVVYGVRTQRKESLLLRIAYSTHYKLMTILSDSPVQPDSGDFCVMTNEFRRTMTANFNELPDYIRGMRSFLGFNQAAFPYERLKREKGVSKYSFFKLLKLSISGITTSSARPLHISIFFGIFIAFCNIAILGFLLVQWLVEFKIFGFSPRDVPGYTSLFLFTNFLIGALIFFNGLTSMYVGNIFTEVKNRPKFIVKDSDIDDER